MRWADCYFLAEEFGSVRVTNRIGESSGAVKGGVRRAPRKERNLEGVTEEDDVSYLILEGQLYLQAFKFIV